MTLLTAYADITRTVERAVGTSWAFLLACLLILVWLISGPWFNYSNTWQLVINTSTTIITFLMVFVIQNTQSRDTQALHLKLDELIRVSEARNEVIAAEVVSDTERNRLHKEFQEVAKGK